MLEVWPAGVHKPPALPLPATIVSVSYEPLLLGQGQSPHLAFTEELPRLHSPLWLPAICTIKVKLYGPQELPQYLLPGVAE